MVHVIKEYDDNDGFHYVVIKLYSACCKDTIVFKKLSDKKYFNVNQMEDAPDGWNSLIEDALKLYRES